MIRWLLGFACALALTTAHAAEPRHFSADSLKTIQAGRAGQPFILTLWSLSCTHCVKELQLLGKLARAGRKLPLVLVSTDTPADTAAIADTLKRHGLDREESWVFADAVPERLQYAIDPAWRGELPRSYLYDAGHGRVGHSGLVGERRLIEWLRTHGRRS